MTKPHSVRITTPKASHYVELLSLKPLPYVAGGGREGYFGFSEFRLNRDGRSLRWLIDDWVPPELLKEGFGWSDSAAVAFRLPGPTKLDENSILEFKVHITSPIIPRTRGLWLRLLVSYHKKDGLVLDGSFARSIEAWVHDGRDWTVAATSMPDWLRVASGGMNPWLIETGRNKNGAKHRSLSEGNTLLCASPQDAGKLLGNLVHFDASLKGDAEGDYRFSLLPLARADGLWDIGTELLVDRRFGAPAPVSDYALLLSHGQRTQAGLGARGLSLTCEPVEDAVDRPSGWKLRWRDVPGQPGSAPRHTFTLESLTQAHLGSHSFGLATTRSRNRLSIVPTWVATLEASGRCEMAFDLQRERFDVVNVSLRRVGFLEPTALRIVCGGAQGTNGKAWELVTLASDKDADVPKAPLFLHWKLARIDGRANSHQLGASSVLLNIDDFREGELSLSCSGDGEAYRRSPPEADVRLQFQSVRYGPLSMDPEIGFETLSALVDRPRPWTFDLEPGAGCPATLWEKASDQQSRMLRVTLRAPEEREIRTDVVLVDPSPMTLVRVRSTEKAEGREIIAEYVDDSDQAPEWRFFSKSGQMTAVLQPQGIGEEMVKGYLFTDVDGAKTPVPLPGKLFDFRLTPVARLVLDRTDIDTARSEAPWSLRRLLSQRTGTTGIKLEKARFELLYGLQADLEKSGLRVAELDGLVGRTPYADALQKALGRWRLGASELEETYAYEVAQWQAGLWHRPSWWRVFTDVTQRDKLVLQNGLQYRLRPGRTTANPFQIGKYATTEGGNADARWARKPLRGGVDWPFQSRNVYDELLLKPASSAGSIEGLAFGTLGGEGSQTAAFNNGKTLIISTSRQGRLDSLTLIRIGRIAMTWNKARHVIVYERTTRRAPRYDGPTPTDDDLETQPALEGMAALRKVREYVEITEPRRRYPDSATDRPVAGPLVQSVFGTTVIPVMSTWGYDVPGGFAIALRGPVPAGKAKFFPEPQVFLNFARPMDKGGGELSQRITSTERLVFFSSTRDQDGGDTDVWPAWPDIDFPSIRPPAVQKLSFRSSFTGLRQPDAPAAELAMAPFTLVLAPAEEAINLMHGRNVAGLEAKLSNINLARGLPVAPRLNDAAQKAHDTAQDFSRQRALLLDGLGDLRAGARHLASVDSTMPIDSDPQLRKDVDQLLRQLKDQVPGTPPVIPAFDLGKLQDDRNAAYLEGAGAEARRLRGQLEDLAVQVRKGANTDLDALRRQAAALADAVNIQAKERLGNLPVVRTQALEQGRSFIEGLEARMSAQLGFGSAQMGQAMTILRTQLAAQPERISALESEWRERVGRIPSAIRTWIETLVPNIEGTLGQWFSQLGGNGTLVLRVKTPIEAALLGLADYLDRWLGSLPPFEIERPDFQAIEDELRKLLDPRLASALLATLKKELAGLLKDLGGWDDALQATREDLDTALKGVQARIMAAANADDLAKLLEEYGTELDKGTIALAELAKSVRDSLKVPASVEAEMAKLQGSFDAIKDYPKKLNEALDEITTNAQATIGDLERAVQQQVAKAEAYIAAGSRQVEEWARGQIAPALDIGKQNIDAALEAVRVLAEGPITQGLQATRDQVGYYYNRALDTLALTPTTAIFNDLGRDALNALSASVPFDAIRDRLLPAINGLAIRDLFPDFCGIKLTDLLPDLNVPPLDGTHEYDWLTIQHHFDEERVSATAEVSINKKFDDDATLFDLGPVKLRLLKPLFYAVASIVIEGGRQREIKYGKLQADFELSLNGKPMVTLADGVLAFDERGKLDFQFDSNKLELAQELTFIQQALRSLMPQVDGLTLTPLLPAGIEAQICLPLPDIGTGAFTLTGITLNSNLGLRVGDGFEIRTGLWLSKPERPFGLAVLFLGGGGWFGIEASFKPPGRFITRVSIGVSAGAFVALNFGFASGSAGLLFTAGVDFYRDWQSGSGSTAVSLGLLMWGEFSILGIASAGVRLMLRITYDEKGGMRGDGTLSVSIKICWCYTLRVSRTVTKQFSGGSSQQARSSFASRTLAAPDIRDARENPLTPSRAKHATDADAERGYASLATPSPREAVESYFKTLAI